MWLSVFNGLAPKALRFVPPFPSFTHWHNFHPTKLFKNKEGNGLPVQASCESHPDIKDLCKSLAGNPSICHSVTSLFHGIIPRRANESENQSNFHSFLTKKFEMVNFLAVYNAHNSN